MKYKRQEMVEEDTSSYSEEVNVAQNNAQDEAPLEEGWEKRYGDLRRHTQGQMNQKDQQLLEMQSQLEAATKAQIKFPKSEDEISEWAAKYPQVYDIVTSIAGKKAQDAMLEGEKKYAHLAELETKLSKKEAEQELMKAHPDFGEIRQSAEFHDWVALQPLNIQDSLYKNNTDARSAARSLDLYKADMRKSKKSTPSAAKAVPRGGSAAAPTNGKQTFSESQIERMSIDEYEALESQIDDARRTGNFQYDVSGAAR